MDSNPQILAFATQGAFGNDEARLRALLEKFKQVEFFEFDSKRKWKSFFGLVRLLQKKKPDLVVMEGSGIAGGGAVILGRLLFGTPYLVSSGDAIAPFLSRRIKVLTPFFYFYERLLCRLCQGFIGWSPYFTGRALTFGAPRAMSVPGWSPHQILGSEREALRSEFRQKWGIKEKDIVIGIVGSLRWNSKVDYCYGLELVECAHEVKRSDLKFLVVGEGSGLPYLKSRAPKENVIFTGFIEREKLKGALAAMDLASLPQSLDQVGLFRYTTKFSEYFASGLPIVCSQIPAAYDLDFGGIWRIPGRTPWGKDYSKNLAHFLENVTAVEISEKRENFKKVDFLFDRDFQISQFTSFLRELCARGE